MIFLRGFLRGFQARRFGTLIVLFVVFATVYMIACDDEKDFGGINVMHDAMRDYISENVAKSE